MLCPICKREVAEPAEGQQPADGQRSWFPFCSERCKLIDLGRWLGGKYQVPVIDTDEAHDGIVESPDTRAPSTGAKRSRPRRDH